MTPLPDHLARWFRANDTACWIFTGGRQSRGYGSIGDGHGSSVLAHRAVWEAIHGPIPHDMTVDHICRNKLCGRPDHLRLLTAGDNVRAARAAITVCPAGHEYTDANTRHRNGRRECRECQRLRARRRRAEAVTA